MTSHAAAVYMHVHLLLNAFCAWLMMLYCVCIMWGNKQFVKICIFYLAIMEPQREHDPKSETIVYNSPVQAQDGMYVYVLNKINSLCSCVWL